MAPTFDNNDPLFVLAIPSGFYLNHVDVANQDFELDSYILGFGCIVLKPIIFWVFGCIVLKVSQVMF